MPLADVRVRPTAVRRAANPKSASTQTSPGANSTFMLFMSPWIKPSSCRNASPLAICGHEAVRDTWGRVAVIGEGCGGCRTSGRLARALSRRWRVSGGHAYVAANTVRQLDGGVVLPGAVASVAAAQVPAPCGGGGPPLTCTSQVTLVLMLMAPPRERQQWFSLLTFCSMPL